MLTRSCCLTDSVFSPCASCLKRLAFRCVAQKKAAAPEPDSGDETAGDRVSSSGEAEETRQKPPRTSFAAAPSSRHRGGAAAEVADPDGYDDRGRQASAASRGKGGEKAGELPARALQNAPSSKSLAKSAAPTNLLRVESRPGGRPDREIDSDAEELASPRGAPHLDRGRERDREGDKENKAPARPPSAAGDSQPAGRLSSGSTKDPQRADLFEDAPAPRAPRQPRERREVAPKKPARQVPHPPRTRSSQTFSCPYS